MATTLLLTIILVGLAIIGLGVSIFFSKKKKFPEIHIGRNKAMRERGIYCASTTDHMEREEYVPIDKERLDKYNNKKSE